MRKKGVWSCPVPKKALSIMKWSVFFFCLGIIQSWAVDSYSQQTRFSLKFEGTKLVQVLNAIENQSEFYFLYNENFVDVNRPVNVQVRDQKIDEVLKQVLEGTGISYSIHDRQIVLTQGSDPGISTGAQPARTVRGKVTGSAGDPIPGVSVSVRGTTAGTITDANGSYSISSVPPDATLVFSFVGMKTVELAVAGKQVLDVALEEETIGIDEVVAIAYGTQKKSEVTGSISSINAEQLKDMPTNNIGQKIQGKFAGVQIYQTSGEPGGSGLSFRIRGQASVNGGNSPLVVIDGFPSRTGIEALSPTEIESITVLKDASATSLYGSRAANGVILITTRQAKNGEKNIEFSTYAGVDIVPDRGRPDVMNAQEFAQFKKEYYEDKARYEGYTGGVPEQYQHPEQIKDGTDWFDILLQDAMTQNYNLSMSSGVANLKSSVNLNYSKQEGVILNTYSEKFNVRANNIYTASDRLTFGLNLGATYRKRQITPGLGNGRNIIGSAFLMDPALKYKNDDGTYPVSFTAPGMFANANYYLVLKQRVNPAKQLNVLANAFAELKIIDGLKYKISANADLGNTVNRKFEPSTARGGMFSAPPLPPIGSYGTDNHLSWLLENTLNYDVTFAGKHNINAFLGYSAQKTTYESSIINASQYPDDEIEWINVATTRVGDASNTEWSMLSYIGRLNYNYQGKYLFSFAFRRDGCSRFGANAKWANFPSVSVGWVASDEAFLKNMEALSWLKLRASYGEVGNNNIGDYRYLATVSTSNYVFGNTVTPGRTISKLGNDNLTWETTRQFDMGFDLGLYKDRIFFVYDYYRKTTEGLLYSTDIPYQAGFGSIDSNIGEFRFRGHEIGLETRNMVGKFQWNTSLNISFNRNEAVKLGTNNTPIGGYANQGDENRTEVGQPLGQFWGYVYDGVYMTQQEVESQPKHASSMIGTVRMKDVGGPEGVPDGIINMDDMTFIGDPNPDFIYGITNSFSWKNFDASVVLAGSVGGDIMNRVLEWTENIDGVFNVTKEVAERWRSEENPGKGKIPRTRTGTTELFRYNNTRWVSDGSYLMAKNITLGYTLPVKFSTLIKNARVYLSVQNAFVITGYDGLNPEVSRDGLNGLHFGVDETFYPVPRTYTVGLNVNF